MAKVGLVLSGGMAKGAYQLGALRAISELFAPEEFSLISCSSIGTLNGYAFTMRRLRQAEEMWLGLCEANPRQSIGHVLRSAFLQQGIGSICSADDTVPTRCYTTLLDIGKRQLTYFNLQQAASGTLPDYLKASVAMPIYNHSVRIGENSFFDGAMVDNIPVYPLLNDPPDYIICIYFDNYSYTFESAFFDRRIIKITFPAENRLKDSVLFRKETIREMLTGGYEDASLLLDTVFRNGKDDLERIAQGITSINRLLPPPRIRITGDVFVTNLNRIAQKFAHRDLR